MNSPPVPEPLPGLDRLLALLREARLTVAVGTSEAIDAARVLVHHARRRAEGGHAEDLAALRLRLRPVLCKSGADLARFDEVFEAWLGEVTQALDRAAGAPAAPAPVASDATTEAAPPATPEAAPAVPPVRRWRVVAGVSATVLAALAIAFWPRSPAPERPTAQPTDPAASTPAVVPDVPRPAEPTPEVPSSAAPAPQASAPVGAPPVRGFTPDWVAHEGLRAPWFFALLALPLLALVPLFGRPLPLPYVTRQRGAGSLTLQDWPPHKQRRQLVRPLVPGTAGQLQRHVRGAVDEREAFARRPQLDLRRTLHATLERGGLLALRYRFARLRPTYLVLLQAGRDDDLPVLWARRLAELDVSAALFRFEALDDGGEPVCLEVDGLGRRLPFGALPGPGPGHRLLIVAHTGVFVDAAGRLRPWAQAARLERWTQRVLFSPDEPRDWPRRHVERLEADAPAGPGLTVLPCEDNALDAWSALLVRGELPEITLEAPQLYPRLLRGDVSRFVGDTGTDALDDDPAKAETLAAQLVTQLQAYLGQNGFYWLCACAVPPLLEPRLALLLGEEYFRRCGASDARVATYMARNWRLMLRLPWLAGSGRQMPQWLRLALLARLPAAIQAELREVVRGALGRRVATSGADGIPLAFEDPDAGPAPAGAAPADPRHALLVGFVRDGLDARELMLRLPGEWQQWLPTSGASGSPRRALAAWRVAWRRLHDLDPTARRQARRAAVGAVAVSALALAILGAVPVSTWPGPLQRWLFVSQAHSLELAGEHGLALDASGRILLDISTRSDRLAGQPVLRDAATAEVLGFLFDMDRPHEAAFSAEGPRLFTIGRDRTIQVWDRTTGARLNVAPPAGGAMAVRPNRDGRRALVLRQDGRAEVWTVTEGGERAEPSSLAFGEGGTTVAVAWGSDEDARVWMARENADDLVHVELKPGVAAVRRPVPGRASDLLDLAPGGQWWLMRHGTQVRLHGWPAAIGAAPMPAEGIPVYDGDVRSARFGAVGRHLLVHARDPDRTVVLKASAALQTSPATRPADLPPDTVFRGRPWHAATPGLPLATGLALWPAVLAVLAVVVALARGGWEARRGAAVPAGAP